MDEIDIETKEFLTQTSLKWHEKYIKVGDNLSWYFEKAFDTFFEMFGRRTVNIAPARIYWGDDVIYEIRNTLMTSDYIFHIKSGWYRMSYLDNETKLKIIQYLNNTY